MLLLDLQLNTQYEYLSQDTLMVIVESLISLNHCFASINIYLHTQNMNFVLFQKKIFKHLQNLEAFKKFYKWWEGKGIGSILLHFDTFNGWIPRYIL